jgi:mannose-6-phosphate isomerase-like protein (cupin superfamily)
MKGFVDDIEALTEGNASFRHVLYTGRHMQLVLMALPEGGEIGTEVHSGTDQFFRIEQGTAEVMIDGKAHSVSAGAGIIVPQGAKHNVRNRGSGPLRLYTIYSPPHHRDGVVQATRAEALADTESFDSRTTESPA